MKKITLKLLSLVTVVVLVAACEDSLDVELQSGQIVDTNFFQTTEDFDAYAFGAYSEMAGDGIGNDGVLQWMLTAGRVSQDVANNAADTQDLTVFMNASTDQFSRYWNTMYQVVSRGNLMLAEVEDAPLEDILEEGERERQREVIEGEAKFFRGFGYLCLARAWGDVPLIITTFNEEQGSMECTPEAEVWAQVIQDLSDASVLLPTRAEWGDANLGRVTKGTALSFLANAYMYTGNWGSARTASEDLIGLGEYNLVTNVRDVFSLANQNNEESLFEIQYREISDGSFVWNGQPNSGHTAGTYTAPIVGADYAPSGGWGLSYMNIKLMDAAEAGDARRTELLKIPGETYFGETMPDELTIPADIFDGTPQEGRFGFTTKFWLGANNGTFEPLNLPVMRYAEFLLNYAEILFENGDSGGAYAQLNLVRQRALLPDLPVSSDRNTFIDDVMQERRLELHYEPNLWFHYTRTGTETQFMQEEHGVDWNPNWSKWPVPQSERNQNQNLCQNPGY